MKPYSELQAVHSQPVPLSILVRKLVEASLPLAVSHHTQIVNEVNRNLLLTNGAEQLMQVMQELIYVVIENSKEGDIHIRADRYRDMVLLQIEERNNNNGYALSFSVGSLSTEAARLGGHISIDGARSRQVLISFCFPAKTAAA